MTSNATYSQRKGWKNGFKVVRQDGENLHSMGLPVDLHQSYKVGKPTRRHAEPGWGALAVFTNVNDAIKRRDTFRFAGYDYDLVIYHCQYLKSEDSWYGLPKNKNPAWTTNVQGEEIWVSQRWLNTDKDGKIINMDNGSDYADIVILVEEFIA